MSKMGEVRCCICNSMAGEKNSGEWFHYNAYAKSVCPRCATGLVQRGSQELTAKLKVDADKLMYDNIELRAALAQARKLYEYSLDKRGTLQHQLKEARQTSVVGEMLKAEREKEPRVYCQEQWGEEFER